ncbi:MAG: hypothetical protein ACRCYS_05205, partial [Beijerinckiaceae bacterium]
MKTGFSRDNRGQSSGRADPYGDRPEATLGDWLGQVIRADAPRYSAGPSADDRSYGFSDRQEDERPRQTGRSRNPRRDHRDFESYEDRAPSRGYRRQEPAAGRTEQALAAVERWIRDSEDRKRSVDTRQSAERDARLSDALE